jgi:hypothetical protein
MNSGAPFQDHHHADFVHLASAFDQLHPNRTPLWMQEEVEWFVERSRALIGYITRQLNGERDPQSENWSIAIEGRGRAGSVPSDRFAMTISPASVTRARCSRRG